MISTEAIRLLGYYTRGCYRIYELAGPSNMEKRFHIMSELFGRKAKQSECGVHAMRKAFYDGLGIKADTLRGQEIELTTKCQAVNL